MSSKKYNSRAKKNKSKRKRFLSSLINVVLILIFLTGVGLLAYPSFSDWWNSFHQTRAVASYIETVADMSAEENEKLWDAAAAYNEELAKTGVKFNLSEEELAEYNSLLNITGTGIMGYIDIPKIKIKLPIYHGVDDAVLQIAIGHLTGTSLPVGGQTAHCVVSGHRGLPSARLFTDIDRLTERDTFTITVLDKTMTYEVDQIRIVLPNELQDLQMVEGKDYVTLVTCTPYGINTHRLLVRAHRIANLADDVRISADALKVDPLIVAPIIAASILAVLLVWLILNTHSRKKKEKLVSEYKKRLKEEGIE